jgi:DNA repair protein RadD
VSLWTPRYYQEDAINGTFDYWAEEGGSPLIVIPTGGGKAGVLGTIMRRLFDNWSDMRIVNLAHVAELVGQNYEELIGMWPWAPAGIYSAGLNRRDTRAQILFASIQSVWNKVEQLGAIDLLIIDEAHMVPRKDTTTYVKFIKRVLELNPDCRLLGLTATDYRLDSGRLTDGEDRLFDKIAYEISIRELIDEGYLTPLISKATATSLDVSGVGKRGGEFVAGQLQAAVDKEDLNRGIIDDIVRYGANRRSWLGFASGVEHAHHLAEETRSRGFSAAVLDGTTPDGERRQMIADFKAYRLRSLWNCGVLTTGFNHPGVDLIAAARPTESAGLYVQIAGRGTRNVYAPGMPLSTREERLAAIAAGPKPNCLFLDFGGLVRRHGPIDLVQPKRPGKGGGDAPVKECPECHSLVHASVMICGDCGYEWERQLSQKITRSASAGPIISKAEPVWKDVTRRSFFRHEKFGSPPSIRVEYSCNDVAHKEWIAVENEKAAGLVARWWKANGGQEPIPATVTEALERVPELKPVAQIRIEPDGKFFKITGRRMGGDAPDEVDTGPKYIRDANGNNIEPKRGNLASLLRPAA